MALCYAEFTTRIQEAEEVTFELHHQHGNLNKGHNALMTVWILHNL